ncbi:MAG: ATP-binding cassette domain-containing protein [Gemmataceae bacterium]
METVLAVQDLTKVYGKGCRRCLVDTGPKAESNLCPHCNCVVALNRVSFTLDRGEILGIMGESGSGKSTLLKLLYMAEPVTSGTAKWFGEEEVDLLSLNPREARRFRDKHFGVVHQNPMLGLNFRITAGGNVAERLLASGNYNYQNIRQRALSLLERTNVPAYWMDQLPTKFSGGMQQRVQIAKALATEPPLLLLDEVTTGLDLSVQARILDLILDLHQQYRLSMIIVTHDIGVVRLLASQTLVMRHGQVVESGLTDQILEDPHHPYTQELISAAL